jgi:hypothetical protein
MTSSTIIRHSDRSGADSSVLMRREMARFLEEKEADLILTSPVEMFDSRDLDDPLMSGSNTFASISDDLLGERSAPIPGEIDTDVVRRRGMLPVGDERGTRRATGKVTGKVKKETGLVSLGADSDFLDLPVA